MQKYLTQNYFELFDLPSSFKIDTQLLAQNYRELQKNVHPDKFASGSDQEKRLSVQLAAHINEANQTLKSPQRRARYILEQNGVVFDDEKDTSLDPEFLMEQIELREALESAEDQQELDEVMKALVSKRDEIMEKLTSMLSKTDQAQLQAAKKEVQKLQFLAKLQSEAEVLEEKILDSV